MLVNAVQLFHPHSSADFSVVRENLDLHNRHPNEPEQFRSHGAYTSTQSPVLWKRHSKRISRTFTLCVLVSVLYLL